MDSVRCGAVRSIWSIQLALLLYSTLHNKNVRRYCCRIEIETEGGSREDGEEAIKTK